MAKPGFMQSGMIAGSKSTDKYSYAGTSAGKQERPLPVDASRPGSRGNSARPRINNSASFVDGCFCNTRGQ